MHRGGLHPRDHVLVEYEDDLWLHERVILSDVVGGMVHVVTAHWDRYEEDTAGWKSVYRRGVRGGVPQRWTPGAATPQAGKVIRFDMELLAERIDGLIAEAAADRLADGGAIVEVDGAPAGAVVPALDPGGGDVWIAMENRAGILAGEPVAIRADDHRTFVAQGDRGLLSLPVNPVHPACIVALAKVDTWKLPAPEPSDDLRTLALYTDASGSRRRDFATTANELVETTFTDWPIPGPRTTAWLLRSMAETGGSPIKRHWWWRTTLGLSIQDEGVEEHQFLSELFETALVYDALAAPQLAVIELAARRFQFWEEAYGEALRQSDAKCAGAALLDHDERALLLGRKHGAKLVLVCPLLEEFVTKQLHEKAALAKERRKAREERTLEPSTNNNLNTEGAASRRRRGGGARQPKNPPEK